MHIMSLPRDLPAGFKIQALLCPFMSVYGLIFCSLSIISKHAFNSGLIMSSSSSSSSEADSSLAYFPFLTRRVLLFLRFFGGFAAFFAMNFSYLFRFRSASVRCSSLAIKSHSTSETSLKLFALGSSMISSRSIAFRSHISRAMRTTSSDRITLPSLLYLMYVLTIPSALVYLKSVINSPMSHSSFTS